MAYLVGDNSGVVRELCAWLPPRLESCEILLTEKSTILIQHLRPREGGRYERTTTFNFHNVGVKPLSKRLNAPLSGSDGNCRGQWRMQSTQEAILKSKCHAASFHVKYNFRMHERRRSKAGRAGTENIDTRYVATGAY